MMNPKEEQNLQKSEAQAYRDAAKAHKDALKSFWLSFLFVGLILFVLLFVIARGGFGWFVQNTKVRANGSAISPIAKQYDLASAGVRQIEESKYLDDAGQPILAEGAKQEFDSYYQKDGSDWVLVEQTQELALVGGGEVAWQLGKESKLFPGCKEEFDFYIIPYTDGEQTYQFSLQLTAFTESEDRSKAVEITDNASLDNLVKGHILMFESCNAGECSAWLGALEGETDESGAYTTITDMQNQLTVSLPDSTRAGVPYKVQLIVVWPKRFQNMIYTGRNNQGDLFSDQTEAYQAISEFIRLQSTKNTLTNSVGNGQANFLFVLGDNEISSLDETFIPTMASYDSMEYVQAMQCGKYFNQADEYIGHHVAYIRISLETN